MLESISEKFANVIGGLRGIGRLSEENIAETARDVRVALLEADVALPVANGFMERIREQAVGAKVAQSLTPGQAFVKVILDELTVLLGSENSRLALRGAKPVTVMLCGLQGSGKTTTAAKLALHMKGKMKMGVFLASCDIHRPAAIEQLETLAKQIKVPCLASADTASAANRLREAQDEAKARLADVLVVDTAGRTTLDQPMMDEIRLLGEAGQPAETLFVLDSMLGQAAVGVAKAFADALPLTGLVLTKLDGDTRGGCALSARAVTGAPIKFVGVGERVEDLDPFHPDRLARRILGMGDVVSIVERAQEKIDTRKAQKLGSKLKKGGKSFTLSDYLDQIEQAEKMGGMGFLADRLPQKVAEAFKGGAAGDNPLGRVKAVIRSMTPQERQFPTIIKASRRKRIARGSGVDVQTVNRTLQNFEMTQKMIGRFAKNPAGMMRAIQGLFG